MRRCALLVLCSVALSVVSPAARAQTGKADARAKADALFDAGIMHQRLGETAQACGFFEASAAVFANPDALIEVGSCRAARDAAASWQSFQAAIVAARSVRDGARRGAYVKVARDHMRELSPRVAQLTFRSSPTPGVRVDITRAGAAAQSTPVTIYGDAVAFNPGRYRLRAWASGRFSYLLDLELGAGDVREIALPALQPLPLDTSDAQPEAPPAAPVPSLPASPASPLPAAPPPPPPAPEPAPGVGAVPVTLVAGGLALVAAGVITGQFSSAERDELRRACGEPDPISERRSCPSDQADTRRRMQRLALVADALWVGGALLAGTGVTIFLLQRDPGPPEAALSLGCFEGGCGLSGTGRF